MLRIRAIAIATVFSWKKGCRLQQQDVRRSLQGPVSKADGNLGLLGHGFGNLAPHAAATK